MRSHGDGVHTIDTPLSFFGMELGARMTVLETTHGLLVHSPVDIDPSEIAHLGALRWAVAPNRLHHLFIGRWIDAGAEAWAAPGLPEKRTDLDFAGVLDADRQPFGDEVLVVPLTCFSFTNEVVLLHRPSRTLIVTDLLFHIQADAPLGTRVAMTLAGGYPGCCTTFVERIGFHRPTARREMAALAALDFDRLIMSHGAVVETGGKEAFRGAMSWLGI